jgi:hypothetical protein
MKFTSEDLMKAMSLQVGDRVKVYDGEIEAIFEIKPNLLLFRQDNEDIKNSNHIYALYDILNLDYEILPRPKRVGELKCDYYKDCDDCPLRILFCDRQTDDEDTLYDILNRWNNEYVNFDQEIYDLLKARLDKEVE